MEKKWFDIALWSPNINEIEDLILSGIDVNAKNYEGKTALHILCQYNQNKNLIDIIQLFIDNGVDVNAEDNEHGRTVLHDTCQIYENEDLIDVLRLLIKNGIDVNAEDIYGCTALHLLFQSNESKESEINVIECVRLFVENGFHVKIAEAEDGIMTLQDHLRKHYKKEDANEILKLLGE